MTAEATLDIESNSVKSASCRLEDRFDPAFVARLALREKQVQQSYRPIIQIHKWFARRPGSVFRSLLLSEFGDQPLSSDYFSGHNVHGIVADPFMGGGTTVFEAARLGLSVVGGDVNPMAYWTVRQAVSPLDLERFQLEADRVVADVAEQIGHLYQTSCTICSGPAEVKYFHLVKTCTCPSCGEETDLFPGLRLAEAVRHPREVYHCPSCNALREVGKTADPRCPECDYDLKQRSTYRGTATCGHCGDSFKFAKLLTQPPRHRMYGMEYRCAHCYPQVKGRQFKTPDAEDRARIERAYQLLAANRDELLIPDESIPAGDETSRLHRWGYHRWSELFSDRQLLGLGLLMRRIGEVENDEARYALATVFSDFLRYQNLLCRYDTYALKCQDIFAVHGFPVALLACENSLLGIPGVGSGSFVHFVAKYVKAKEYAKRPYETDYAGRRKVVVPTAGESIEAPLTECEPTAEVQGAWLSAAPSQKLTLRPASLDGVFTDPPYFDMVQYAELMDFCYVWLRKFMGGRVEFAPETTRTDDELNWARGLDKSMKSNPGYFTTRGGSSALTVSRVTALFKAACNALAEGASNTQDGMIHRLDKIDTKEGLESIRYVAEQHVPYAVLLYERYLGRPFASHRDGVSELVGDVMENAIEDLLSDARVPFRKTKRAERVPGFDQAPDFFTPDELDPTVIIEAKITGDDGTARDKVSRILRLAAMRDAREREGRRAFEVVACIDGRGFGVRREDMGQMITATRGKVFTANSLQDLIRHTRLSEFLPTL